MRKITKLFVLAIAAFLLSACSKRESCFDGLYLSVDPLEQAELTICEYESGKTGILIKDVDGLHASFAEMTVSIQDGDTIADFRLPNGRQPQGWHGAVLTRQKVSLTGDSEYPLLLFPDADRGFMLMGKYKDDSDEIKATKAAMQVMLKE